MYRTYLILGRISLGIWRIGLSLCLFVASLGVTGIHVAAGTIYCGRFRAEGSQVFILLGGVYLGDEVEPILWKATPTQVPLDDQLHAIGNFSLDSKDITTIQPIETSFGTVIRAVSGDHPILEEIDIADCPRRLPSQQIQAFNVVLQDFALTEVELTQSAFTRNPEVTQFRAYSLWLHIFNAGPATFIPPAGGANYTIVVSFKPKDGEETKLAEFRSDLFRLKPIYTLGKGLMSPNPSIYPVYFPIETDAAEIKITFKPDLSSGLKESSKVKPLKVLPHPELLNCEKFGMELATALQRLIAGDPLSAWLTVVAANITQMKIAMPTCSSFYDQIVAQLTEYYRNNTKVAASAMTMSSNTNVVLTDVTGKRLGFLKDGTTINEILGSRVFSVGNAKALLYPSNVKIIKGEVFGDGEVALYMLLSRPKGRFLSFSFADVLMSNTSVAKLDLTQSVILRLDSNGDGKIDQTFRAAQSSR